MSEPDLTDDGHEISHVYLAASKQEYWFDEGCFITEWLNDPFDQSVSVARARVLPGTSTRWHRLAGVRERYVVIAGAGEVEVSGLPATTLTVGDCISIAPGAAQRIHNRGITDLVFLAICTPRFEPAYYTEGL